MSAGASPPFRWNANPPWNHFSSLVREAAEAKSAPSEFHRHHHLRAALYFGIGTIEAFLNQEMRGQLKATGAPDGEILTKLKRTYFPEKAKTWPAELAGAAGSGVQLPPGILERLLELNTLRGEITHDKAKDHAVYVELEKVQPEDVVSVVSEYVVRVREVEKRPYWYWLLAWNFVGMNGSVHWPFLSSNQQFMMALRHIGFDVPSVLVHEMDAWESRHMTSVAGFQAVEEALSAAPCQPRDSRFPFMPRLCRRWWDDEHVKSCGEERPLPWPRFV